MANVKVFRAQEPKAPVTYCDHALSSVCLPSSVCPSSVRLFTFSTSSPEPLDGFWWNLVWMKYSRSLTSVVVFRPDPSRGGAKIGHGGPLLQETSSSDWKATATNRMHSDDLETCGKKCCYFWFHSEVKFLTRFDVFLDLVKFALFNAISIDFYAVKSFICINFV